MDSLTSLLNDGDDEVVWNAVEAISQLDLYSLGAVEAYRKALHHKNFLVRGAAASGLCRHNPEGIDAIPILIEQVDHEDQFVRREALFALSYSAPSARSAIPRLIEALRDRDKFVRGAAAYTLGRIDESNKTTAISVLKELLNDPNTAVANESRYLLLETDPSEVPLPEIGFLR